MLIILSANTYSQSASKVKGFGYSTGIKEGEVAYANPRKQDTLKSGDTLAYVAKLLTSTIAYPYVSQNWSLISSDTTVTLTVYQSNDGVKWHIVQAGASPTNYTKSITNTATTGTAQYHFLTDQAYLGGVYIKFMYIAKTKTGFKSIPQFSFHLLTN